MVTIKNFKKREAKTGDEFFVLVLEGGITPVRSKETGRMYFTQKTCTVPTTFDEDTCNQLIGQEFQGEIVKVKVPSFEYVLPESGDVITLEHRWEYKDETIENQQIIEENVISEEEVM
ncbi:hypothetical protein [Algibacter sp. 2305UL17-15]|uniref:hypothetical protein n=1 Tax=Algibacter sp. 2305UL17-15 TaxID=3231268 RepID=UPI0034594BDB